MRKRSWGYLTRAGSERDLVQEHGAGATVVAEGVVLAESRPKRPDGTWLDPVFARQAMQSPTAVSIDHPPTLVGAARRKLGTVPWSLQIVAPDARDPMDPRRAVAAQIQEWFLDALDSELRVDDRDAVDLVQIWVVEEGTAWVGRTAARSALSRWSGGRTRLRREKEAVSRAGLKLEEAIEWAGVGPERGDLVADLGAAPGGWTQVLLQRGATVIAVDPKNVRVSAPPKRFAHLKQSAFEYSPPETLDWVVCDIAFRPLEVAKLLAKWARRSWARQLISNIKLPMKQKTATLDRVKSTLEAAGWEDVRIRQLYHDREEVTLYAHLSARLAVRPAQAPSRLSRVKRGATTRARLRSRPRKRKTSVKRD
jgi:23S rRNA (cytidine2498-2'-O)-methyltransferase